MKKEIIVCPECGGSGKFFFFFDCPVCLGKKKVEKEEQNENQLLINFYQQKFFHFY